MVVNLKYCVLSNMQGRSTVLKMFLYINLKIHIQNVVSSLRIINMQLGPDSAGANDNIPL